MENRKVRESPRRIRSGVFDFGTFLDTIHELIPLQPPVPDDTQPSVARAQVNPVLRLDLDPSPGA